MDAPPAEPPSEMPPDPSPKPPGARFRFASYNVEWFNALFDNDDRLLDDGGWSARHNIRRHDQARAIARVFRAVDADAMLVVEAPDSNHRRSSVRALENFARHYGLRSHAAVSGFQSETQQELTLLFDPRRIRAEHAPRGGGTAELGSGPAPRFDRSVKIDLDGNGRPEPVVFSKPPLELAVSAGGRQIRMIGVHVKSKAPTGATSPEDITRLAIDNRRKQLAQCLWLRARVVEDLKAGDSLIVLGDFNDGPGLDEYESLFGRSGVEIVMGESGPLHLYDPNARIALADGDGPQPSSARFMVPDAETGRYEWLSALLDFILISPTLREADPAWRIWHPFDDADCADNPRLRAALLTASDHFPVTLDLTL